MDRNDSGFSIMSCLCNSDVTGSRPAASVGSLIRHIEMCLHQQKQTTLSKVHNILLSYITTVL